MNKTQKNWKKTWEEYEPTEYDQIYRSPRQRRKTTKKRSGFITAILVLLLYVGGSYVRQWNDTLFETKPISNVSETFQAPTIKQNKNGIIMSENISRILEIFDEVSKNSNSISKDTITGYIENIKQMDLSEEYEKLKIQSVRKLNLAKQFCDSKQKKTTKELQSLIEEYNAINIISYIVEAFEQAEIEYVVEETGGISYRYYK